MKGKHIETNGTGTLALFEGESQRNVLGGLF